MSLEKEGLIRAHVESGSGPDRKVYRITDAGLARLREDGAGHLSSPAHPRSEIDLGIYALPFLIPGLAFERPLLALRAELEWLERVAAEYERRDPSATEWGEYVYREPPGVERERGRKPSGEPS